KDLSDGSGLVSPILALSGEPPGIAGLVGNVSPVPKPFANVRKCVFSSLISFPTCPSFVPAESISAAGLATEVYTSLPSFDATIEITTRPVPPVAGLVDDFEASSSKNPTQV